MNEQEDNETEVEEIYEPTQEEENNVHMLDDIKLNPNTPNFRKILIAMLMVFFGCGFFWFMSNADTIPTILSFVGVCVFAYLLFEKKRGD